MEIVKKYGLEKEDYKRFFMGYSKLQLCLVILCVFGLVLLVNGFILGFTWIAVSTAIVSGLIMFPLGLIISYFTYRRFYKINCDKDELVESRFSEDSLSQKSDGILSSYEYNHFEKIREDKMSFYLFSSYSKALIVPKRIFNQEELVIFRGFLRKSVTPKKLKLLA